MLGTVFGSCCSCIQTGFDLFSTAVADRFVSEQAQQLEESGKRNNPDTDPVAEADVKASKTGCIVAPSDEDGTNTGCACGKQQGSACCQAALSDQDSQPSGPHEEGEPDNTSLPVFTSGVKERLQHLQKDIAAEQQGKAESLGMADRA